MSNARDDRLLTLCQSTSSSKGTTITTYQDLEHAAVGTYDDYVLNLLDPIMVKANSYGIKVQSRPVLVCRLC
jgi:hypothetical protein